MIKRQVMKTSENQQNAIHNHEVPGSSPGPVTNKMS